MIGLLSEINNGDELTLLVNNGIFALIEYILKESGSEYLNVFVILSKRRILFSWFYLISYVSEAEMSSKTSISNDFDPQAIFEDDQNTIRFNNTSSKGTAIPVSSGPGLLPYIKPGLRVVRGPDWKWGDQVYIVSLSSVASRDFLKEQGPLVRH